MKIPEDLKYTENDEWVRVEGDSATVGITDYAQDQLSDVVYVEVSVDSGAQLDRGEVFGVVESVKAASDIYMPVSGQISAVNSELPGTPELINTDPYGEAWMIKLEMSDAAEYDDLMDAAAYAAFIEERST